MRDKYNTLDRDLKRDKLDKETIAKYEKQEIDIQKLHRDYKEGKRDG